MSKYKTMDKLIKRLKNSIAFAENELADMDSVSWDMQEGILISYNEAKKLISGYEWKSGTPDFDGQFLVLIYQKQECGNVWKYQKVIECFMNRWVVEDESEDIVGWKELSNNEVAV